MVRARVLVAVVGGGLLVLCGCSAARESSTAQSPTVEAQRTDTPASTAAPASTERSAPSTTTPATATTTATTIEPITTPRPTTTTGPTTTERATTTTAPDPLAGVHNRRCVVRIEPGDALSLIAAGVERRAVTVLSLQVENGIVDPDAINAGDLLDICVRNKIDDISGDRRVPPTPAPTPTPPTGQPVPTDATGVVAQQQKLNELFAGYGLPPLAVDGDSGRLTEQQLCAARVALGLPIGRSDMEPGGAEEQTLMTAGSLSIPATAPVSSARWALIDQACQVMFVGEGGDRLVHVFPTSTGEPGHETRDQVASRVFRFDPARENNGWHNSSIYPVTADNPLNGNMYMPLYFDAGQAIHGANNVPPDPQSKGCARLPVASQDALIDWLGLRDVGAPLWDESQIDLTVSVQGRY